MKHPLLKTAAMVAAGTVLSIAPLATTLAADFPTKPVHIIVPYAAGGIGDQLARALQKPMQAYLKQPVIVENFPGAGGVIGSTRVARARPDGYTLLLGNTGPLSVSPQVSKPQYDPIKDFAPVGMVAQTPLFLAIPGDNPATSLKAFLDQARVSGTAWNYGSTGPGSLSNLTGEYFNSAAGLKLTHIPYNGGAQMVGAFAGGDLHVAFVTGPDSIAMLQAGKIRYLAIATPQRTNMAPGLPAIAEEVPGFTSDVWYGLLAPAGTPDDVQDKLRDAMRHAIEQPETQRAFEGRYLDVRFDTGEALAQRIRNEIDHWGKVIRDAKLSFN